jgi:hypothetical protein
VTRALCASARDAELQPFLYALIGDEKHGMALSVLSALARRNIDPWVQAGDWSRLPRQTATLELASLISALPDGPSVRPAPEAIAARLIALLPSPPFGATRSRPHSLAAQGMPIIFHYALLALLAAWMIVGLFDSARPVKDVAPVSSPAPASDSGTRQGR